MRKCQYVRTVGFSLFNVLTGQVRDSIYLGNSLDRRVDVDGYEMRVQIDPDKELPRGVTVYLTCPFDACRYLPLGGMETHSPLF